MTKKLLKGPVFPRDRGKKHSIYSSWGTDRKNRRGDTISTCCPNKVDFERPVTGNGIN